MQVQPQGKVTASMVICPGCSSKLVIPESSGAETFRCPKCRQFLATSHPDPFASGQSAAVDSWSGGGWSAAPQGPTPIGFSPSPQSAAPIKRSSTQWKPQIHYSERIQSVPPGVILLIWAVIGLLLNAFQFFYALGINDPKLLGDPEVVAMKILFILASCFGGLYLIAIALGASQMILRQRLWAGRTACILTVFPATVFAYGNLCFGIVLYPFAAAVAIWGLVVLFRRP